MNGLDRRRANTDSWMHVLGEGTRVARAALFANWRRTVLTVLGVGIGAGVVVTVAAVIEGIRSEVLGAVESAGPNNFTLMPFDFSEVRVILDGSGRPSWFDRPPISDREIRRVRTLPGVGLAVAGFEFGAALRYRSNWVNASWRASSSEWPAFFPGDFLSGRDFTPAEVNQARAVVVLSASLAEAVFGQLDPVGKRLRVNAGRRAANELFTVVGVYEPEDNLFGEASSNFAITPYTAADKRLKARDRFTFINVQVAPREGVTPQDAQEQIISALRSMRGLRPGEDNNFGFVRSDQIADLFNQLTGAFFAVMIGLSSVGMLVGGIGVIGIMLISVTERTREIGIRKAVGATQREIKWQFLIEASLLTATGAAAGLMIGWGISELLAYYTPLPARIPLWSVFAAISLAALTGILFGMIPALRAAKLDPVDALRYE
ncbi:MAG: ABC transporter permease [Gemmatimonadetes bacterium]|nr:ABC transporter permease [Gemmatimonadota bacterium]